MKTITIANRKGGVSKTTTAHNMGAGLMLRGFKVLFVDLDSQANLSAVMGASGGHLSIKDVIQGADPKEAIQATPEGDIIASDEMLATIEELNGLELKKALKSIAPLYDYCIIDTAPALDDVTISGYIASNEVILTAQADLLSVKGLKSLLEKLENVKKHYNKGLKIAGILLTRYSRRAIISQQYREFITDLMKEKGLPVYKTVIRENTAIKEAQALHTNIFKYSSRSNGAADYNSFIEEYLQKGE